MNGSRWDYRVLHRHTEYPGQVVEAVDSFEIIECYYDAEGNIKYWSDDNIRPGGDTFGDLAGNLGAMVAAGIRPVLTLDDLPGRK